MTCRLLRRMHDVFAGCCQATPRPLDLGATRQPRPLPPVPGSPQGDRCPPPLPFYPTDRYWKWQEAQDASWTGEGVDQQMQRRFRRPLLRKRHTPHLGFGV